MSGPSPTGKNKKLVIFGSSEFAEIAFEYFMHDSDYAVKAFCVEKNFLTKERLFDLPLIAFEDVPRLYPPDEHSIFIACVYTQLNRLRTRLLQTAKTWGYKPASYVSSKAFVWRNVKMGEHCFIFENNVVQPFVTIGNNVVLWSGNHIGHHSVIGNNVFISSHVVISGGVEIGDNCFIGVNATVNNAVKVGRDCFLASASLITKHVGDDKVVKGMEIAGVGAKKFLGLKPEDP